jgi:drug/metabolite transporter (DMT)-like permease
MTRRTLWLFLLLGLLWGVPYLFIKVAVDPDSGLSPAIVVFGRVAIGSLILLPLALRDKTLGDAIRGIKYVALYALMEMIGPWILIGTAEQSISSGLAGLLVHQCRFGQRSSLGTTGIRQSSNQKGLPEC